MSARACDARLAPLLPLASHPRRCAVQALAVPARVESSAAELPARLRRCNDWPEHQNLHDVAHVRARVRRITHAMSMRHTTTGSQMGPRGMGHYPVGANVKSAIDL